MRSDIQLIYFDSICVCTVVVSTFAIILSLIVLAVPSSVFVCLFLFYLLFLLIFYTLTKKQVTFASANIHLLFKKNTLRDKHSEVYPNTLIL
jgi:hypothetical protein